jgi:hypothetical protein
MQAAKEMGRAQLTGRGTNSDALQGKGKFLRSPGVVSKKESENRLRAHADHDS